MSTAQVGTYFQGCRHFLLLFLPEMITPLAAPEREKERTAVFRVAAYYSAL